MRVATGITTANDAEPQTPSSRASESLAGNVETLQIRDCDVCCPIDVEDTYRSRQCVINTGGGSLNIDGMRTGRGGSQVVINRGDGDVRIRDMRALDDSMQFVCCSDNEKDIQAMLQAMRARRPPPPHLHTAELAIALSKIWCIAQEQKTAPMFGGLCSETIAEGKHRWRCLFFQSSAAGRQLLVCSCRHRAMITSLTTVLLPSRYFCVN
ncbi:hypothetical protein K456DRAFT_1317045 [Colletotrichum gloeosporioides 23]|nr:hypothetical protein K456DRAFT_1317045 [Colletotrichum gloeosporioides 23]